MVVFEVPGFGLADVAELNSDAMGGKH